MHILFKRFSTTKITPQVMAVAKNIVHENLRHRRLRPEATITNLQQALNYSRQDAKVIYWALKQPENRIRFLHAMTSLIHYENELVYTPMDTILTTNFLEWCGGLFDGDGCVTNNGGGSPTIEIKQNKSELKLLIYAFGNDMSKVDSIQAIYHWYNCGIRAYIIAKILVPHTNKKRKELEFLIEFFEGKINFTEYENLVRKQKKEKYLVMNFDIDEWSWPKIAGWIDSDGSISVMSNNRGTSYLPKLTFSQKNTTICESFRRRFGGSVSRRMDGQFQFQLLGKKAWN